ncbi:MAG: dihydropyrimidinase [Clostridium sp.]|uniref:dihydropyrimidinase n=1 Tax=Clostridium sp. TaxID=1506 RepID=UPI003F2F25E4
MRFDTIIRNGTIITATDIFKGDIGIKDGKINKIGIKLEEEGDIVIDAKDKLIFPGGIDPHTHLDMPFGGTFSSDNFKTGTIAAACGGTTTIIDFAVQPKNMDLLETARIWREKSDGNAVIDYGIHMNITHIDDEILDEIPLMIKKGYPSFKVFMTYKGMRVDDGTLYKTLKKVNENGGLTCVHAENFHIIECNVWKLLKEGKTEPKYHAISRGPLVEGEAVARAINIAKMAESPLYIVHNTCKEAVLEIARARDEEYPIMGETCTQYLLLSDDEYNRDGFEGAKYVMSPPLRSKDNFKYLWRAIRNNTLQVVATDHCPFFMKQKELGINSFDKIPNGAPGVELRMALLYTYGVLENEISINKFVEVTSTNAAKIYGMYPKKGTIAVGSDGDLVIFDPNKELEVTLDILHENVDYTPYEGFKIKGFPEVTLSRGEIIASNGKFVGRSGRGEFIKRNSPIIL